MSTLRAVEPLFKKGAIPQVTCRPLIIQIDLRKPFIFANLPCWKPAFDRPVEEQMRFYPDEKFRAEFRKEMEAPKVFLGKWERVVIHQVGNPALEPADRQDRGRGGPTARQGWHRHLPGSVYRG